MTRKETKKIREACVLILVLSAAFLASTIAAFVDGAWLPGLVGTLLTILTWRYWAFCVYHVKRYWALPKE